MIELADLYQEMILDHYRHPRNTEPISDETHSAAGHNPLCGDSVDVHLRVRDGIVEDISIKGVGCAISTASSSLMSETIRGKSVEEVEHLFAKFQQMVTAPLDATPNTEGLGKLQVFSGVRGFPVRIKCATLAWHTVKAALEGSTEPVTTEVGE